MAFIAEGGASSGDPQILHVNAAAAAQLNAIDCYYESVQAHLISQQERERLGRSKDMELTYGVTAPAVLVELLGIAEVTPDDVFCDLGCGVGHATLTAAVFCRHAYGIEFVQGLHEAACQAQEALKVDNVTFVRGDCREVSIAEGTVFFAYSTCFREPLMAALAERLTAQPPGTRVITCTRSLAHPAFEVYRKERRPWGEKYAGPCHQRWVYFHRRREDTV